MWLSTMPKRVSQTEVESVLQTMGPLKALDLMVSMHSSFKINGSRYALPCVSL